MAFVIPFAIQAAGALLATSTVTIAVLSTIASVGIGLYQKRRAQKKAIDAYNASLQDRLVMVATADQARSIVYGRVRTNDGVVFKGSRPPNNGFLDLVVVVAAHEIDGFEKFYIGDQEVTVDGEFLVNEAPYRSDGKESKTLIVASTGGAQTVTLPQTPLAAAKVTYSNGRGSLGAITTGADVSFNSAGITGNITISYQVVDSGSWARIIPFTGFPGQDLSYALSAYYPGLMTSEHKFEGMACLLVTLAYEPSVYPSGVPSITALIRGKKVYDPRDPAQDPDDSDTWLWSENPALCARDFALHENGGGCFADEIDETSFVTAANACDVSHTYEDSAGVEATRAMFTCGYVAKTDISPDQNMNELVESMAGKHGWSGGRLKVRAGSYSSPVATITDDWLADGERQITPGPGFGDLVNIMRPSISDSAQKYVGTPIAEVRAEAYITADGMELPIETTMLAVNFAPQAQHVCAIQMREMRQGMTVNWPVNMKGFSLELFDTVNLTSSRYGFAAKPFEVVGWGFSPQGSVALTLKETGASIYQPDDIFPANDPEDNTSLPLPWVVPTITGLTAESGTDQLLLQADGSVTTRALITFDAIEDEAVLTGGAIEVEFVSMRDFSRQSLEFPADAAIYISGLEDGTHYIFKARARNRLCKGAWSEEVLHEVVGKTESPENVAGLSAVIVPGGVKVTWTTGSEVDYAATELHAESVWSDATAPLFIGRAATYTIPWPAQGSLTILAKHIDTTGNKSTTAASVTLTVDATIFIGTSYIAANAVTNGSVVNNATTTGGSLTVGSSVAAGFLVGPTITTVAGDEIDVEVYGTHIQRLFFNAYIAEVEIWMTIGFGGPEIGVRRKFQMPFNAATGDTKIPILMSAQIAPGAATSQIICEYTVTCLDSTGSTVSALKDWESEGEWRSRRTKR